ncbi:TPA: DUF551 domain-containing protein [Klebsiella pneumoniae]|nr:DUF551 domain-containing protein [Klebsiella pneumoniae]MCQ8373472.1 DUF551 domain-containing protein [Klebsiella pneumoniae]MCQ8489048.1 DUF551 domain-containing protein [Klebsiella pneumoniae]QYG23809.1 DUF551 domain-containing protein [Klebsiella pneumoniae]HBR5571875.1 DUF551 domain-containing protein [Klebsiella pneumoniae]
MLQAQSDADGEPTDDERIMAIEGIIKPISDCDTPVYPDVEKRIADAVELLKKAAPAMLTDNGDPDGPLAGRMKSPVIPDGYVMVPIRLTAENGAKGALSGEFSETKFVNCQECFGDDECETCDGSGRIKITVPVTWTTIKEIWAKGVEHFAAAPQSPGSEPATVPGKWIPVSEQMPEEGGDMIVFTDGIVMSGVSYAKKKGFYIQALEYDDDEPVDSVTHWMPLPADPQEVKP